MEYLGLDKIKGSLVFLEGIKNPAFDEIVTIGIDNQPTRTGRVLQVMEDKAVVLVFEGTQGLSLSGTVTHFTGKQMEMILSQDLLGRVFNGLGQPIDDLGGVYGSVKRLVSGKATNPVNRVYPRNYISTGFSSIDGLITLIRGQKLPIFSADGLPHDRLAMDIATQAQIADEKTNFAVVFAAMGISHDTADFFRKSLIESGQQQRTIMYLNLASDPPTQRITTPRFALTAAEYLAYDLGFHVLVILTDMTSYAESLREISSARGEIPSRKGYPGYMYSDLASIYERAGILKGKKGSITQLPILTMPNNDITHPIPDLTGYITEGQIVLESALNRRGIYPPINVLPSLSRLMKDGIGEGYTTKDHPKLAAKLFATYAKVEDVRALASIIGEDDLTEDDRELINFGNRFEEEFVHQKPYESRGLNETLEIAKLLM